MSELAKRLREAADEPKYRHMDIRPLLLEAAAALSGVVRARPKSEWSVFERRIHDTHGTPPPDVEAALSGVRVPVDELRIVTEFFGERNWPDTKVGNAAYALHGRLLAASKGERDD